MKRTKEQILDRISKLKPKGKEFSLGSEHTYVKKLAVI